MSEAASLVTVGIPTYNREPGLRRAVESVLAQRHGPIDLVICDNASTDGTRRMCLDLEARHPNVRYVRQETNLGSTANFNRVFSEARGPYFMWLGDDDWIDPDCVGECLDALRADPSAVLAAGSAVYHRGDEVVRRGVVMDLDAPRPGDRVARYFELVTENGVFYGLARADALRRAMPMPDEMGSDWFVVARLAYLGRVHRPRHRLALDGLRRPGDHGPDGPGRSMLGHRRPSLPARRGPEVGSPAVPLARQAFRGLTASRASSTRPLRCSAGPCGAGRPSPPVPGAGDRRGDRPQP